MSFVMVRLAAILMLVCSGCAFDPSVSVDEPPEDPATEDPGEQTPETDPAPETDPTPVCVDQTFKLQVSKDFDPNSQFVPDERALAAPLDIELPRDVQVDTGSAGSRCAYLDLHLDGLLPIRCGYLGDGFGGGRGGFSGGGDGQDYDFVECREGSDPSFDFCGDDNQGQLLDIIPFDFVTSDRVVLRVDDDSDMGTTVISVELVGLCPLP